MSNKALEGLLKIGSVKAAPRNEANIQQWLSVAEELLRGAKVEGLPPSMRFLAGYEGIHNVAMAFLNHHEARPGDGEGHRVTALTVTAQELGFTTVKLMTDIHNARNTKTYRDPLPPIGEALAKTTVNALEKALVSIRAIAPAPSPPPPATL